MRTLGLSQSFTSQNSGCKVSQNGSSRAQRPWLHIPEHHCQIQSKWLSFKQGPGALTRDSVQLTLNSVFFFISNFWSNIINIVKERVFGARDFIEILALLLLALCPWARSHMSQFLQVNNRLNATYVVGELWRGCCGIVSCWLNGVPNTVSLIVSAEQITVFPHLCPRVKNYKCCLGKCCQKILKSTTVKEWMPTGHEHIYGCSMFS